MRWWDDGMMEMTGDGQWAEVMLPYWQQILALAHQIGQIYPHHLLRMLNPCHTLEMAGGDTQSFSHDCQGSILMRVPGGAEHYNGFEITTDLVRPCRELGGYWGVWRR